jgi:hypothetical protein
MTPFARAFKIVTLTAALLLSTAATLYAERTVLYNGNAVVKVAYQNPTEVIFEGDQIAHVILGFPTDSISLQNTSNTLYIQPLVENLTGDIYVVMRDGTSKIVSLVSTIPDLRDRSVKIINNVEDVSERVRKVNSSGLTPAGLIKAMILGQDIDGVSVSPASQVIIDIPIQLTAQTVYDAVYLKGFIVDMTDHPNFDIKTIAMKGLVAGAMHQNKGYFVFQVE